MKTLAALAMASATMATPLPACATMQNASSQIVRPVLVGGAYRTERNGNASRPDHLTGEFSRYRSLINFSSGSFSVGDFASIGLQKDTALLDDILVGAALLLQSAQSPLDRDIQEIVSSKFESYWD